VPRSPHPNAIADVDSDVDRRYASNMRSVRSVPEEELPLSLPLAPAGRPSRSGPGRRGVEPQATYRVTGLARTRGWPDGTELFLEPSIRPARGDVVVVREGEESVAGVFERRFGRPVLVSDRGVRWIGPQAEVVGVATLVGASLEGMPDPR